MMSFSVKKLRVATGALILSIAMPALAIDTTLSSQGAGVSGAINDGLFYSIGGGSVISPPSTRSNMSRLGLDGGWSSDLMCGNFDLKTTVGNQLNGVTSGFKDLMGNVIQGATGAVMSMPAMAIQRANPGLYEMLTNGVLQAGLNFDKAQMNCQNMSKKLADYTLGSKWQQAAVSEEYKDIVSSSGGDAVSSDQKLQKATGEEGVTWVGGQKRGGKGQQAIQPTRDLAKAGYNMMNSLPVTSNSSVGSTPSRAGTTAASTCRCCGWLQRRRVTAPIAGSRFSRQRLPADRSEKASAAQWQSSLNRLKSSSVTAMTVQCSETACR